MWGWQELKIDRILWDEEALGTEQPSFSALASPSPLFWFALKLFFPLLASSIPFILLRPIHLRLRPHHFLAILPTLTPPYHFTTLPSLISHLLYFIILILLQPKFNFQPIVFLNVHIILPHFTVKVPVVPL